MALDLSTWLYPLKVHGKEGLLLQDVWDERGDAEAYLGTAMDDSPSFFIILGPNTATSHSSVMLAIENLIEYSLRFIQTTLSGEVETVEVKKSAEIE
ncbi:hypothetical protein MMC27_008207 [Xylographa pallens]|nr:hypothetical protein [Xylographa pallens]